MNLSKIHKLFLIGLIFVSCTSDFDYYGGISELPCVVLEKTSIRRSGHGLPMISCQCQDTILKTFEVTNDVYLRFQVGDTIKNFTENEYR